MRRTIATLVDANYRRQVRLPRDTGDFRTPALVTAGQSIEAKMVAQRAWLAELQSSDSGKVIYFGGHQRGSVAK